MLKCTALAFPLFLAIHFSLAEEISPRLTEAIAALNEGIPQAAIVKLHQELTDPLKLPLDERKLAKTKLAEALLAAGQLDEALQAVRDPEVHEPLLEARIDAAARKWSDALAIYDTLPANASQPDIALSRAECLCHLERVPEAVAALEKVESTAPVNARLRLAELYLEQGQLDKCKKLLATIQPHTPGEQKWKQYADARLFLAEGQSDYALGRFKHLLLYDPQHNPQGLTENLLAGAALGWTEASNELHGLTAADDVLEGFIFSNSANPHLNLIFRRLDELYSCEESPSEEKLKVWSERKPSGRAGFAVYYLAKDLDRTGKPDAALDKLRDFAQRFPNHPILPEALLLQGKLLADQRNFAEAHKALDAATRAAADDLTRAEIEMASGIAHFQAGEYVLAATVFRDVADQAPAFRANALFNSALSWLNQGNYVRFAHDNKELSDRYPESVLRQELILEEGLLQARQSQPQAEATLRQFIRDFPDNPRVPEARLALAELCFAKNDAPGASHYLHAVNSGTAPIQTMEQSDFLAIFVADTAANHSDDKVITLGQSFIDRYPESPHLPEVRMKLGQVYFRREEFNNAQTQFELLAREAPGSPLTEKALFLAGEASIKSQSPSGLDAAVDLFGKVAKINGPLKLYARLQLAKIQNRQGKADDAIRLYDDILQSDPPTEVKFEALAEKGLNLFEMGAQDPANYEKAIAVYDELAAAAETRSNATWHNQALYKKGQCLEKLKRPAEALTAYYDVLQAGVSKPQEYFWFYKAGFDAGHLCESQEQWKSAVGIYQKVSALDGPRAEEAKSLMLKLQMEHFIWD